MKRLLLILGVVGLVVLLGYFFMHKKAEAPASVGADETSGQTTEEHTDVNLQAPQGGFEIEPEVIKKPPQEAIDACAGHKEGSACSVVAPNGTLAGTCLTSGAYLSCVPN